MGKVLVLFGGGGGGEVVRDAIVSVIVIVRVFEG